MSKKISLFASILKSLLDETGLFDRKEWSEALGVSELEITQWVNDRDIPSADTLLMIILILERSSDLLPAFKEIRLAFEKMSQCRSTDVSSKGKLMLPTVETYMLRPSFSKLSNDLAKLNEDQRELLLMKEFPEKPEPKKKVVVKKKKGKK